MATEAEILTKLNDLLDGIASVLDGAGASKLVTLDRDTGADAALVYLRENGDEKFRWGMPGGEDDFVIQRSPDGSALSYADVFRIDATTGAITITGLALDGAIFADTTFTGQSLFADGSAAAPSIANDGDDNTGLFFPASDVVAVAAGGSEVMRIGANGRVGINTSNPLYQLDANGSIAATGTSAEVVALAGSDFTNFAQLRLWQGAAESRIESRAGGTYISPPLTFRVANYERVRITADGDVLIGTSTPGASKLVVNDDSIQIKTQKTPASASATGTTGQIAWDASFVYVCTATDTWKRAAIATW